MPRYARKESSTGVYHVMARGLNKMAIFKETREKTRMLKLIEEHLKDYNMTICAYCIMSNHFHLLIKADLNELASYMAKILAGYAKYYNFKHNRIGYVFQDRYKSQCVERESYFLNCIRYIHMNPSADKSPKKALNYAYSSMKDYYFGRNEIIKEEVQLYLAEKLCSRKEFMEFHKSSSWDVFEDVAEEATIEYMRIAKEVLEHIASKHDVSKLEVLEYVKIRNEYTQELIKVLGKSKKQVISIEKEIRSNLTGTG